ncbi:MAG: UvrD-helicase domain-containing protein [Acidobacteriota bacterium]|nr:UvrD-helicase domain-containing protein [Acidobacteriota bacterium]
MISDRPERERALDPSRSFIVQAPAGSGKTSLLVQRYLRLLSTVEKPESVVAMTFTRKAAGELKERILQALLDAHQRTPVDSDHDRRTRELANAALKRDRERGWNVLGDPRRLQILTIDSLCATLTRQMPVESGFGGVARVVEDAGALYRLAARDTLRNLAEDLGEGEALLTRLGIYFDSDLASLEGQIVRMLAQRDQWRFSATEDEGEVADFCALLGRAEQALRDVFRRQGEVDFTAITQAAIEVLGLHDQPSDVLYGLDYRLQHLLVDEFQDTSRAQYELIDALTAQWSDGDGHTLFLVGDPMQSIYGFRGAEVSLFLQSWHEGLLRSVRLEPLTLRANFRSTPEIIDWIQHQFEPIMSDDTEGGVQFRPSYASRPESGQVPEFTSLIDDKNGEAEANLVASFAKEARKRGTVAILIRSRNHLSSILPALRENGLPYEAVDIDNLAEQQHVQDLLSLTRAILHVADRISWLACLRAPWCGLTLSDLSIFAEGERDRTILELLLDPAKIAGLSVQGRTNAVRVGEILSAAVSKAARVPLRKLLEDAWLLLGGPALLQQPHQAEDVRTFFDLIESLDEGGTITDFMLLRERLGCLFAKPAKGENYIQIMTVHQAKGLEFDTVVIPQLGGGSKSTERDLLVWSEHIHENGSSTLAVAAQPRKGEKDKHYDSIKKERTDKEKHERKRLFYVGCTRAKNALHLIGNVKTCKDGTELSKPWHDSFLRLIWDNVESDFEGVLRRSPLQRSLFAEGVRQSTPKTILRRLPVRWQLPRFARSVTWQPQLIATTASARKVTYEWVSDTGRHVGTVVHELLKRAAEIAIDLAQVDPIISAELLRLGVPSKDEPAAAARAKRALTNTLSSERGHWILAPHVESRSEWPLGGTVDNRLISGTVDRMFRDEEGVLWIIDYKTSEHQGGQLERFLDEEQRRYRPQLESYAALIARIAPGPISLGLYFPLLDAWRAWSFVTSETLVAH